MKFSKRAMQVTPSATIQVSSQAKKMIRNGIDVINLGIGEPDFTTPTTIDNEAITAIKNGKTSFYTPASGLPELKQAIADRIQTDYDIHYDTAQISVTNGAKMALYVLMQVLVEQGDEVLLPKPSWVSYHEQVKLAGATPVMVDTDRNFKITTVSLDQAVTATTKLLIINTPQNPTGTVYSEADLKTIGDWAVNHQIIMITDDIYGKLVYNQNRFYSPVQLGGDIAANTILVSGVSKTYSMTGWRIGYIAGNSELIQRVNSVLSHSTGNPATVSQYAAIAALRSDQSDAERMRQAFENRLNTIYPLVQKIPGFDVAVKPEGAFYLFPRITEAMKLAGVSSSAEFVKLLLNEAHVAVVDGDAFGLPGYLRLSYAASLADLKTAVARIDKFMNQFLEKQVSGGIGIETN
ncbi:pyridoxal phosphate-dependent aminotransferase [Lentilactobacillus diolivorans]|uniref:pyridoxal phosphate-dependent aminotransferase n=1 Tax=Lentilactobacillus diolivorans TaxID=179838 RepID=UPI002469912A|nr:pyridoxal phosphate-dependent aminotransferase [Lentilactobacillus diolivorans]MDH5105906.1 pyridoxal phosphate-dependent aminotransferase [Lentilactobacillus diolivorans]